MPAQSRAQQEAIAIAEHQPGKLYKRNSGLLSMSKQQLSDFASTPRKGLPYKTERSTMKYGKNLMRPPKNKEMDESPDMEKAETKPDREPMVKTAKLKFRKNLLRP